LALFGCTDAVEETNREWNALNVNAVRRTLGPTATPEFRNIEFVGVSIPSTCGEFRAHPGEEFRRFVGHGPGNLFLEGEGEQEHFDAMWTLSCVKPE